MISTDKIRPLIVSLFHRHPSVYPFVLSAISSLLKPLVWMIEYELIFVRLLCQAQ